MVSPAVAEAGYPVSDIDPFSRDYLREPYPFHAQLREAGPVVWLSNGTAGRLPGSPKSLPFCETRRHFAPAPGSALSISISSSLGVRRACCWKRIRPITPAAAPSWGACCRCQI